MMELILIRPLSFGLAEISLTYLPPRLDPNPQKKHLSN